MESTLYGMFEHAIHKYLASATSVDMTNIILTYIDQESTVEAEFTVCDHATAKALLKTLKKLNRKSINSALRNQLTRLFDKKLRKMTEKERKRLRETELKSTIVVYPSNLRERSNVAEKVIHYFDLLDPFFCFYTRAYVCTV